ncbi:MAG: hypothetical protein ACT4PM_06815 [Gemmatimonadales bacterium]
MPPASQPVMTGDFLVPLLRTDGGAPDPAAIETWHLALGSAVAVEIPHDLFALWLFPGGNESAGAAVLLGPEALAADRIEVPVPAPTLQQDDLFRLEETLRQAKYPSALAAPVRHGERDVGVMLLGSFLRGAFGPAQAAALRRLGDQLAPILADLGARLAAASPRPVLQPDVTRDTLVEHLARAVCEAVSGADLVSRISGVLYPLLPHDGLEILAPAASGTLLRLSGKATARRWGGMGTTGSEPLAAIGERFGEASTLLIPDLGELSPPIDWEPASHPLPARSLLGARLTVGGATAGYVLLGSVAQDAYRPEDEDLLALTAQVLAPRVAALRATPPAEAPRDGAPAPPEEPPIHRAAAALANRPGLRDGLREFAAALARVLPHEGLSLHLRRGDTEILELDAEAPRPLADLPPVPLAEFAGAPLLTEEREWLLITREEDQELLVPLKVAGRAVGTLGVRCVQVPGPRQAAAVMRHFADVLAPHLELLRRALVQGVSIVESSTTLTP